LAAKRAAAQPTETGDRIKGRRRNYWGDPL